MLILCRADASHFLGTGHVMRQLTLADVLRQEGAEVRFVCRDHPGHLADMIAARGFACHLLTREAEGILGADWAQDAQATADLARDLGADWVFADHYGIDARWERQMPARVLVMDDMFDRPHDCDVLLNQNLGTRAAQYAGLIPARTLCLMGTDYALLRPEFMDRRPAALARREAEQDLREILITMGGSDQPNATGWVLDLLGAMDLPKDVHLTIIMGPTAPHLEQIRIRAAALPHASTVLAGTSQMAALMARADLAIGAAGSTSWERCALGLPAIQIILAENQRDIGAALHRAGAAHSLDLGEAEAFTQAATALVGDAALRAEMARTAAQIVDGRGPHRVLETLRKLPDRVVL